MGRGGGGGASFGHGRARRFALLASERPRDGSRTGWGHTHGPPHAILFRKLSESSFQRCMGLGVEDVPADREIPGDRPRSTEIHPDFGRYRQVAGDSIAYFLIAQRVDLTT